MGSHGTPSATAYKKITIAVLHQEPTFSQMLIAHVLARSIRVEEDLGVTVIWLPLMQVLPGSTR